MQHGLQHVVRLIDLFPGHRLNPQLVTAARLAAFLRSQRLVIGDIRFRFFQCFLVTRLVNGEQHLVFLHQLVIVDVNRRDKTGHVGGDRHDIGAKTRVTRPR